MDDFRKVLILALFVSALSCTTDKDSSKKTYVAWFFVSGLLFLLTFAVERM